MSRALVLLLSLSIVCLAGAAKAACDGKVLFEDGFDDDLSGWVAIPDRERIEGSQYIITPVADASFASILPTFFFDDRPLCVEIEVEHVDDNSSDSGLIFWGEDYDNYYLLQAGVNADGVHENAIYRRVDGEWVRIFFAEATTFKVGAGVVNRLQVEIDNGIVTTSINGLPVRSFRGQVPDGRYQIGVYGQADTQGGSMAFNTILVTAPGTE